MVSTDGAGNREKLPMKTEDKDNISIKLSPDIVKRLDELAKRKRMNRTQVIVTAVVRYVAAETADTEPDFYAVYDEVVEKIKRLKLQGNY